jgi:putative heme-binding domain-containing protein
LALLQIIQRDEAPPEARDEVVALAVELPSIEVRDLFERFLPPERRAKRLGTVINAEELLAMAADAERGRQLFFRDGGATCKSCHRANGQGETLGPDLSQIGKKYAPRDLLTHLLEPSKLIEPKYVAYVLESTDGRVWTGLLVERTETEVLLRTAQNQPIRLKTDEIEVLVPQPKSLMPELLLRDLTPQQAADLLAYLSSLRAETAAAPPTGE